MPHRRRPLPPPETIEEAGARIVTVEGWFRAMSGRLARNEKLRRWALVTALLCLIAACFSAGYAVRSREQANSANAALRAQVVVNEEQGELNRASICGSARSTALAFREPQVSSDGTPEPEEHFLDRMRAQRDSLVLAAPLNCESLPGFDHFSRDRATALEELSDLLAGG